jgi:hypothetical protein
VTASEQTPMAGPDHGTNHQTAAHSGLVRCSLLP